MCAVAAEQYTIDQLAQLTGVTTRNIRAHQSRGLLPPPLLKGRTGFYGPEHAARLRLIVEMQADGFNLGAIKRVLAATPPGSAPAMVRFGQAWRATWQDEKPEVTTSESLLGRLGGPEQSRLLRQAVRLGLVRHLGEDKYELLSPTLLRAAEEFAAIGVPLEDALALQGQLVRHTDGIARSFVGLYLRQVWEPFQSAGLPESEWPRINGSLERLPPAALEAVVASFRLSMAVATEKAFGEALQRQARRSRKR
jgi:DNA-binding transcriptional MerR regulator